MSSRHGKRTFVKVASVLSAGVLFSACAATEWFSAPGVEARECSAQADSVASEPVSPSSGGELSSSASESLRGAWSSLLDGARGDGDVARVDGLVSGVDDAVVRGLLFDGDDADRVAGVLEKFPDDSAFLDRSAAVVLGRLNSGEELTHSDKRVVGTVFARGGARGAYTALQGRDVEDQARQLVAIWTKHGVGERFLSCAVIGEGLAGGERVVLDAVMKASAEAGVSKDGREWLLAAMVARADEVFTTLSGEVDEVFGAFVRVGVGVTEGAEAQNRFVYALREAYRQAVTSPRAVEQPIGVYLDVARGVGAVVEIVTRGGQREEIPRMTVARTLTHYRYVYCAEYKQTSCPDLPDMSEASTDKERNAPENEWATIARKNLAIVVVHQAPKSETSKLIRENFDKVDPIIIEAVSKGERPQWATQNELYVFASSSLLSPSATETFGVRKWGLQEDVSSRAEETAKVIATMDKAS